MIALQVNEPSVHVEMRHLENQLLASAAAAIAGAISPAAALQEQAAARQRRALLDRMRAAEAQGRISIRLTSIDEFKGTPSDLVLNEGDKVEKGQVILILESMKMQNELKSPKAGTVGRIRVKQGEKVEQRQALMSVQ